MKESSAHGKGRRSGEKEGTKREILSEYIKVEHVASGRKENMDQV